jgi:hypothetical protein
MEKPGRMVSSCPRSNRAAHKYALRYYRSSAPA